jgi:Xaa-Pro aminopeptidase
MKGKEKLQALRNRMKKHGVSALVQPVHDEYMNEYPPAAARRVEWLTGFSGSAGAVAVTLDKAAIFVDGRYTLQAKDQVDGALYEQHNISDLTPDSWLTKIFDKNARVGYDAKLHTRDSVKRLEAALAKKSIGLIAVPNLIDTIWQDKPPAPATALFVHDLKYSGEASASKRQRIAGDIVNAGADAAVITAPDAVCWLFNIRAHDVENAPLVLAPAIIDAHGKAQLFVASSRCDAQVRAHLSNEVAICEPDTLEETLKSLGKAKKRVLVDPHSAPVWFSQMLADAGALPVDVQDPCLLPKAMKNPVELQGMRAAHIRDGLAVTRLLCWLDRETAKRQVMEMEVGDQLLKFRAASELFREASFNTISGSGPHGAIVHYRVTHKTNRALEKGELFLLDSGGQYPDGTTDITRTVPIGKSPIEARDRFTRVLKGHIAIAMARFPEGTAGSQLDVLARQYLWQVGLDYDHGTGHGVGCFLNVHEGPQRISKRGGDAALKPGMIVSNEPGYYKTGAYGIRIENLVAVSEREIGNGKKYLGFETLTCAPIDTRLVDAAMLTLQEKQWLNNYHAWVYEQLSPDLDENERSWLKARCSALA